MTHPWSSDPAAHAAIRAAEDGHTEPVPTLSEVIDRQRALMTKSVSVSNAETLENKGEHMRENGRAVVHIDADATIDERVVVDRPLLTEEEREAVDTARAYLPPELTEIAAILSRLSRR